ncbi:glycosyltransferase family 2 protein [Gaetbulibacter jejuensis]
MKNQPLVSICIPTYNGADYIVQAMDSALAQTYPNLEIVVSDDASIDATLELIASYKTKTSIPIYIHHHTPNGIGANWNHCVRKANGEYIKFLFQDDVLLPECVALMVAVLEQHQTIALVASKREFIVESSYLNDTSKAWIDTYNDLQCTLDYPVKNAIQVLNRSLFKHQSYFDSPRNKVGEPSTLLFRTSLLDTVGYFREDLKQILDYEFYNRVLKRYSIAIMQEPLVKFRLHGQQATVLNKNNDQTDYVIYDRLMYDDYLWSLNKDMRLYFLKKYNPFVRLVFKGLKRLKRLQWK